MANKLLSCCEIYCYLCLTLGFVFYLVLYALAMTSNEFFLEEKAKGVGARTETMSETFYSAIVRITINVIQRLITEYSCSWHRW